MSVARRCAATVTALLLVTSLARADEPAHPLKPPDRSSPRATLTTFLESCDAVAAFVAGEYMSAPTRAGFERMRNLAQVPIDCLDLSEVAPASRPKIGPSAALNIYEVLCRIELPPVEETPGAVHPGPTGTADEQHWTIPNTEITLVRGPAGTFRFSADTVARSREFFERVRRLPYARPIPLPNIGDLPIEGGGWLIPLSWVHSMPAWLRAPLAGQSVWKWIALTIVLSLFALLLGYAHRLSRRGSMERPVLQALLRLILPASLLALTPIVAYVALVQINLVGGVGGEVMIATTTAVFLAGAWLLWRVAPVIAEAIVASPHIASQSVDAHLIRIFARLLGIVGSAGLLALGADRIGVPVYGIVAGLGVGGLALALAAQPTIENLIGGLSLFADKPMKVGDYGKYGDVLGTVEGIGIRSTRVRGIDRTLTTIPNAALSRSSIVNFAQRDRMLIQTAIGVRYETSPAQLRFVLAKLREMLRAHPQIAADKMRVRFVGFGASSLDIELFAYALTKDPAEFRAIQEDVYLRVMGVIEQAGTSIAFPSQTHYIVDDRGMNAENTRTAEVEVSTWREEARLPFADLSSVPAPDIYTAAAHPPESRTSLAPEPAPAASRPPDSAPE